MNEDEQSSGNLTIPDDFIDEFVPAQAWCLSTFGGPRFAFDVLSIGFEPVAGPTSSEKVFRSAKPTRNS
jgi:hypothetical protein